MPKRAYIFGNAKISAEEIIFFRRIKFSEDDLIICADGGYDNIALTDIKPHVIIGDMDSVSSPIPDSILQIKHPKVKDKLDTYLCIDYALEKGCTEIILLSCFGGRVDHSLASLISLRYIAERRAEGMLLNKNSRVVLMTKSGTIKKGEYSAVSLIPSTNKVEGITTSGLQYKMTNETLLHSECKGVSNSFTKPEAEISFTKGALYVICEM